MEGYHATVKKDTFSLSQEVDSVEWFSFEEKKKGLLVVVVLLSYNRETKEHNVQEEIERIVLTIDAIG